MKDPTQIAAEAWRKLTVAHAGTLTDEMAIAIIQAAIEKAQREAKREQHELDWAAFRKLWERRFKGEPGGIRHRKGGET